MQDDLAFLSQVRQLSHSPDFLAKMQVAKQEGEYLAKLLGEGHVRPEQALPPGTKPFAYSHKGSLAYVGSDKAVMDVPQLGPLTGRTAGAFIPLVMLAHKI